MVGDVHPLRGLKEQLLPMERNKDIDSIFIKGSCCPWRYHINNCWTIDDQHGNFGDHFTCMGIAAGFQAIQESLLG